MGRCREVAGITGSIKALKACMKTKMSLEKEQGKKKKMGEAGREMIFSAGVSQGIKSCFSSPLSGIIQYIKADAPLLFIAVTLTQQSWGCTWNQMVPGRERGGRRQPPGSITLLSDTGKMNYSPKSRLLIR